MNYFDYKPKCQMGKVWALFQKLAKLTDEEILADDRHNYTHTLDIISSALSGNISLEDENLSTFNLQAYEARCRANDKNTMRANVDKMLYIVDSGVMEESSGEKLSYGDIAERNLPRNQDDYNLVLSRTSMDENLNYLCSLRNEYIINHGVDIVELLKSSLSGIRDATGKLTELAQKDERISETLMYLCEDSRDSEDGELLKKVVARC